MSKDTKRWFFYETENRKPLSGEEVNYWKSTLSRILKVGYEFEFNLPEKKNGTCKGDSPFCPCTKVGSDADCWQKCIAADVCAVMAKTTATCSNVTGTCEDEMCETCQHFASQCAGIYCTGFISACHTCNEAVKPCDECKFKYDPKKSPEAIRQHLSRELMPSNSYGCVGASGVHSITTDGSLLGGEEGSRKKGAEIITVGRRVDFWEFYKMTKNIIDKASEKGAYMNERCSTHMHVLGSYYGKVVGGQEQYGIPNRIDEMERDMPEIIMANLHQLVRRYQNAITWMTMALNEPDRLTRWEKFRVSVLPVSAVLHTMPVVQSKVSENAGGNKYGWINYNFTEFAQDGNIRRLHVEFRVCDGLMSPSAAAAMACLFYALLIKATDLSRYGLLEVGDEEWLHKANKMKELILNNKSGWNDGDRFANTSKLLKNKDYFVDEAIELIVQLKSALHKTGPAFDVLEKLAEKPIALRRMEGETWEEIENSLKVPTSQEDELDITLSEFINLSVVKNCVDIKEWMGRVVSVLSDELKMSDDKAAERLSMYIEQKQKDGELIWSSKIGSPMFIR